MPPDADGRQGTGHATGPAGSTALRDRVRRRVPRPGLATLGRASALLLVLLGLATLLHPGSRAVLGGAPGVLSVLLGSTLLFVLVDPLDLLRRSENRILGALLETLFPATADVGADPVDVADRLQALLPALPLLDRLALRFTAWLLLVSPLLLFRSPRPFPLLDRRGREDVCRTLGSTRIVPVRALFTLVKGTLAMVHFERDAVLEEVGWTPADSGYREG